MRPAPFKRIACPGTVPNVGRLFVTIEWDGAQLSITGVEGPLSNGDARGSCGQCGISPHLTVASGWTAEMVSKLTEAWDRWHLNDMRAGCEHQRAAWDATVPLKLVELGWTAKFHELQRAAGKGEMLPEEYVAFSSKSRAAYMLTVETGRPKHPVLWGEQGDQMIAEGLLKASEPEIRPAGQVYPYEHPEGLLLKPCPECGYKYGSAWVYEEVPVEILEFLAALPDASEYMPACWQ